MNQLLASQKEKLKIAIKAAKELGYDILGYEPDLSVVPNKKSRSPELLIEKMKACGMDLVPPPKPGDSDYVPDFEGYDFSFFKDQRLAERARRNAGKSTPGAPDKAAIRKKIKPRDALALGIFFGLWIGLIFSSIFELRHLTDQLFCSPGAFLCGYGRTANIIRFLGLLPPAMIIAFTFTALVIPPDDRLDATKFAAVLLILAASCLAVLWGCAGYFYLTDSKIVFRTLAAPTVEKHYGWNDVVKIRTECSVTNGKGGSHYNRGFYIYFQNGDSVETSLDQAHKFYYAYPQIRAGLGNTPVAFETDLDPRCMRWLESFHVFPDSGTLRWVDILQRPPLQNGDPAR